MKVSELIELLKDMPQDLEVITDSGCGYHEPTPRIVGLNDDCRRAYDLYSIVYVEI